MFHTHTLVWQFTYSRSQRTTNLFIHFSNIKNNLESINSNVHKYVHRRQSTEFRAHQKLISQYITKTCRSITQAVYNVYIELIFYRNY